MTDLDDKITNSGWVILELVEERNELLSQKIEELESVQKSYAVSYLWSAMYKNSMKLWRIAARWEQHMGEREAERADKLLSERKLFTTIAKITVMDLCDCPTLYFEFDPSRHGSGCTYQLAVEEEIKNETLRTG